MSVMRNDLDDWDEFDRLRRWLEEAGKNRRPQWPLETRLSILVQEQGCCSSEVLGSFFTRDPAIDVLDAVATDFDLDSVSQEEVDNAKLDFYYFSQDKMKARGFPEEFLVWRCGDMQSHEGPRDVTSVTYDRAVAERGCKGGYYGAGTRREVHAYRIKRKDVLVDVGAIWPQGFAEAELLVHPDALLPAGHVHNPASPSKLKAKLLR